MSSLRRDQQVAVVAGEAGEVGDVGEIGHQQGVEPLLLELAANLVGGVRRGTWRKAVRLEAGGWRSEGNQPRANELAGEARELRQATVSEAGGTRGKLGNFGGGIRRAMCVILMVRRHRPTPQLVDPGLQPPASSLPHVPRHPRNRVLLRPSAAQLRRQVPLSARAQRHGGDRDRGPRARPPRDAGRLLRHQERGEHLDRRQPRPPHAAAPRRPGRADAPARWASRCICSTRIRRRRTSPS